MRIADTSFPIARGHAPITVVSNVVYILAALGVVALRPSLGGFAIAFALTIQALGSMLFHATRKRARWAQLLDAVGIQWVLAGLLAASVSSFFGEPAWFTTGIAVIILWPAWWLFAHKVNRNGAIALQALWLLYVITVQAGWWTGGAFISALAAAIYLQITGRVHGWRHALWHLITSGIQAGAALILLGA